MAQGDVVLGLASSGAHSNGFSLLRKILTHANARPNQDLGGRSLEDAVMEPTRIYVKPVLAALAEHGDAIKGLAHITGGGLLDNRSEEHTSELQSLMRNSYAVSCLKKTNKTYRHNVRTTM